jgi:biopolymer transport protein ExbD
MPKVLLPSGSNGGRHTRGRRISTTLAEINVIPLVDVMLVLLIIFMVTAPMLQRGVEVRLPVSRESREIASERLFVDVPVSYRRDRRVYLDKEAIGVDKLAERVRQLLVNRSDKRVFLRTDGRLNVQDMIDVISSLTAGGVLEAGIVTEAPVRQ